MDFNQSIIHLNHIHILYRLSKTQQSLALMTLLRCMLIMRLWIFSNETVLQTTWFFAVDSGTIVEMSWLFAWPQGRLKQKQVSCWKFLSLKKLWWRVIGEVKRVCIRSGWCRATHDKQRCVTSARAAAKEICQIAHRKNITKPIVSSVSPLSYLSHKDYNNNDVFHPSTGAAPQDPGLEAKL